MSQEIVKKKAAYPTELTEMQRRFCEYLIMNEGRTTRTEAAIHAGYSPKSATQEAAGLIRNPKIQAYIVKRSNEINRAFTVTKSNYVRRQQVLSQALVDQGKIDKALGYENNSLVKKLGPVYGSQWRDWGEAGSPRYRALIPGAARGWGLSTSTLRPRR